jgi:uncharacterized lipoprotein YddW (UPF0748 family)
MGRPSLLCVRRLVLTMTATSIFWTLLPLGGCTPNGATGVTEPGPSRVETHAPPPRPRNVWPPRAVWVVRQTYSSPGEIAALMDNCQQAGFNTVLFQVRGNATAFHRSRIEPPAEEFRGQDPGFDQLAVACEEAHRRGMALHAWVNVMPAWRGTAPPADSRQIYNTRPDWFWYDQHGKRQPLIGRSGRPTYVSLNPCLPEVRQYLVSVFEEIVRNYPVDGLHLDYIRFPFDEAARGIDYPHDQKTLALYRQATGKRPQDDRARWSQWRTEQITQLVRDIRHMTSRHPGTRLTVAGGADLADWRKHHFQDGPGWLRSNLVDLVFVMNYTADMQVYRRRQEEWRRAAPGRMIAPGLGVYMHADDQVTIDQLRLASQWGQGFAIFSSNSLFDASPRSNRRLQAIQPTLLTTGRSQTPHFLAPY